MDMIITLDMIGVGEMFTVKDYKNRSEVSERLKDLGLVKGTKGVVFALAPLGGAACIAFRGYKLSIGKRELKKIVVMVNR